MRSNQSGFTIIELLIATAVFSIILIISTAALIGISQIYIRGSVQDETQQSARKVLSDVSQDLQFNDPTLTVASYGTNEYYVCTGSDVYFYRLDLELSQTAPPDNIPHSYSPWVLVRYPSINCPGVASISASSPNLSGVGGDGFPVGAEELLSNNERLGELSIQSSSAGGILSDVVNIIVGYGDDTLLNDKGLNGPHVPTQPTYNGSGSPNDKYDYGCVSGSDNSFCSVSTLTTIVSPRIGN